MPLTLEAVRSIGNDVANCCIKMRGWNPGFRAMSIDSEKGTARPVDLEANFDQMVTFMNHFATCVPHIDVASAIWLIAHQILDKSGDPLFPKESAEADAHAAGKRTKHMIGYLRLIRRKHDRSKHSNRIDTLKTLVKFDASYWTPARIQKCNEQAAKREALKSAKATTAKHKDVQEISSDEGTPIPMSDGEDCADVDLDYDDIENLLSDTEDREENFATDLLQEGEGPVQQIADLSQFRKNEPVPVPDLSEQRIITGKKRKAKAGEGEGEDENDKEQDGKKKKKKNEKEVTKKPAGFVGKKPAAAGEQEDPVNPADGSNEPPKSRARKNRLNSSPSPGALPKHVLEEYLKSFGEEYQQQFAFIPMALWPRVQPGGKHYYTTLCPQGICIGISLKGEYLYLEKDSAGGRVRKCFGWKSADGGKDVKAAYLELKEKYHNVPAASP
jgi:hypothetical protein